MLLGQIGAVWGNLNRGVYVRNRIALVVLINYASFRVIVKMSSPKNLSADRRPTGFAKNIGYLSADSRTTVCNLSVACR